MVDNIFMFSTYKGNLYVNIPLDRYITGSMLMKEIRLLQQQMLITTNPLWSSALAKVKCNRFEKEWVKPTC